MASEARTTLKTYFQTGDKPTQAQFINLIDSAYNPTDDGTPVVGTLVTSVGTPGSDTNIPSEAAVRTAIGAVGGTGDIKADGTVDFTAIVGYDAHKTFTADTDIPDKKYVDDVVAGLALTAGTGDVVGPASAVDSNFAAFNSTTGKLIKDSGSKASDFATAGHNHTGTYKAVGADETANVSAASTTAQGKVELAIGSEVTTGTDDTRAATPKAIKDAGIVAATTTTVGTLISGATGKTTPVDADTLGLSDSAASNVLKSLTWANVKATLKTYFDTVYSAIYVLVIGAPATDHSATGITRTYTAGENLTFGQACYIKSDGKAWLAKADAATTMPSKYIALGTIAANASGSFSVRGIVRDDSWTWTIGGPVYVSAVTGGLLTQTAPTGTGKQVQIVGVADSATTIDVAPNLMLLELA